MSDNQEQRFDGNPYFQANGAAQGHEQAHSQQGQVPPSYGQAPPQQGQVPPSYGQVPPQQGQVPPPYGQVPPQQGQVPPPYGQVPPPYGQVPPPHGYYGYPPHMPPPHMPPMWPHPMWMHHPAYWPNHPQVPPQPVAQEAESNPQSDAFFEQAQAMLEETLGEEAGIFKELLGSIGMNDKEFWKGAMVGAAAAVLLSNENVRNKMLELVSGAGGMLKTGGSAVKDTATNTASQVRENVTTGGEIFRDTFVAGKEGFQQSVERHQEKATVETESDVSINQSEDTNGNSDKPT